MYDSYCHNNSDNDNDYINNVYFVCFCGNAIEKKLSPD